MLGMFSATPTDTSAAATVMPMIILRYLTRTSSKSNKLTVFCALGATGVGRLEAGGVAVTVTVFVNSVCCGGEFTGLGGILP